MCSVVKVFVKFWQQLEAAGSFMIYIDQCISNGVNVMHVSKWGNSLAVRLPASVVEALDLKEGDDIEIDVAGARHFSISKAAGNALILERLRA